MALRGGWGSTQSASELAPSPPYTGLSAEEAPLLPPPSRAAGSVFSAGQPSFKWEEEGSAGWAAIAGISHVGLALLALSCPLALNIVDATGRNTGLIQTCSYDKVGNWGPWCEWSRAFVVGLPTLAMSVLLTTFVRFMAHRVLFVRLLRAGTMMGHEPLYVRYDWSFMFLVVAYVMALTHFSFAIKAGELGAGWTGGWMGTTVFFFCALYAAYVSEAAPSIISVYAESPHWAREHMGRVRYISSASVHAEAKRVLADWHTRGAEATFNDLAASIVAGANPHLPDRPNVGWAHALWPVKVLGNRSLTDEESENFRFTWIFVALVYFGMELAFLGIFVYGAVQAGVRVHGGSPEAAFGMLANVIQALAVLTATVVAFVHTGSGACIRVS